MTLVIYEMEPIGVDGALEAVEAHHVCSPQCRDKWPRMGAVKISYGEDNEIIPGEVCDTCGGPLPAPNLKGSK